MTKIETDGFLSDEAFGEMLRTLRSCQ